MHAVVLLLNLFSLSPTEIDIHLEASTAAPSLLELQRRKNGALQSERKARIALGAETVGKGLLIAAASIVGVQGVYLISTATVLSILRAQGSYVDPFRAAFAGWFENHFAVFAVVAGLVALSGLIVWGIAYLAFPDAARRLTDAQRELKSIEADMAARKSTVQTPRSEFSAVPTVGYTFQF